MISNKHIFPYTTNTPIALLELKDKELVESEYTLKEGKTFDAELIVEYVNYKGKEIPTLLLNYNDKYYIIPTELSDTNTTFEKNTIADKVESKNAVVKKNKTFINYIAPIAATLVGVIIIRKKNLNPKTTILVIIASLLIGFTPKIVTNIKLKRK